jgi:hypothetical protein
MDAGGRLSFDELLPQLPYTRDLNRDRKTAKEDWETMSKDDQERSMRMIIVALQQYGQGRIEVAANFPNRGRLRPSHYPSTIVAEAANGSRRRFVAENRKDLVEYLKGDVDAAIAADNTDARCEFVMFRCTVAYEQTGTLPDRKHYRVTTRVAEKLRALTWFGDKASYADIMLDGLETHSSRPLLEHNSCYQHRMEEAKAMVICSPYEPGNSIHSPVHLLRIREEPKMSLIVEVSKGVLEYT